MATKTARTAKKATYKGVVLARVYDKVTGAVLGYVAKPSKPLNADGTVKIWYQVTCDHHANWHCTCEGNATFGRQCMHIDAAIELCGIRVKQGRPGCQVAPEVIPVVVAPAVVVDPEKARSLAILTALAAAIPGVKLGVDPTPAKQDLATRPLSQSRSFALPPTWGELAAQKRTA